MTNLGSKPGLVPNETRMKILETERLVLCRLSADDAAFIVELLNDPSFLRYIGDKGVRTLDDARDYILNGPVASYEKHGFGLSLVRLKPAGTRIGICGLLQRESLEDVDIGFAFLPEFQGQGYGTESARAVMAHGTKVLGIPRIVAVTSPDNAASIHVLEKLGLKFEKLVRLRADEAEIMLFG